MPNLQNGQCQSDEKAPRAKPQPRFCNGGLKAHHPGSFAAGRGALSPYLQSNLDFCPVRFAAFCWHNSLAQIRPLFGHLSPIKCSERVSPPPYRKKSRTNSSAFLFLNHTKRKKWWSRPYDIISCDRYKCEDSNFFCHL